ncbi:hypothetical protein SCP_1101260 [Sparassis crispa]|uniref:Rhodopsin domain-containing protein n=1 Tax=Sparassis crispa TaxID=139825 RepID=A0A401GZ69_9APHY|nr:hypothetical protein SCP_1101260 [Sparassis crispa]GBE87450.1 hypothetical protein SCP_1101260 [Sparassis crispa]
MSFITDIRVVATVFPGIAFILTLLRLYYRWSRKHLGYDDAWAAFALCSVFFMTGGAWLHSGRTQSRYHKIIGYYFVNVSFTCVLWSARMSILASILRIIPHMLVLRRYAYAGSFLFLAMWAANIIQKVYICEHHTAWKRLPGVQCVLGNSVGAVELATDITADIILVALPLHLLWGIGITSPRRKLLITIFSASMITTIVSIVHAGYVFSPIRNGEAIAAHLEASVSLIVCNLAVLVTWLVRALRPNEDLDEVRGISDDSRRLSGLRRSQLSTLRFVRDPPIVLVTMEQHSDPTRTGESTVKSSVSSGMFPVQDKSGVFDGKVFEETDKEKIGEQALP